MKKRVILISLVIMLLLVISLFSISVVNADEDIEGVVSVVDEGDGGDSGGDSGGGSSVGGGSSPVENIEKYAGDVDPETGLPKRISDPIKKVEEGKEKLEDKEKRESWFKEILTSISENKFVVVTKDVSGKFFSFFDFLWIYSFGSEFSWSLSFFASVFIWICLVVIIYFPVKTVSDSGFFISILVSIIISSLTGASGLIKRVVDVLGVMFTDFLWFTLIFIIGVILLFIYGKFFSKFKKQSEEDELKQSDEQRRKAGKSALEFLKGISGGK